MAGDRLFKAFLPLAIVVGGMVGLYLLAGLRHGPARHPAAEPGVLVEVVEAHPSDYRVVVRGTGVIRARRRVAIMPQVSGRIVWISPRFVQGGRFRKGERMAQIERSDYVIALKDAEARLSKALQEFEVAKNRSLVEKRQWRRLHPQGEQPPTPLVFFEPQLKAAEAAVEAARASKERAALDLERTAIKAPFDCRVISKQVDVGSVVGPGMIMGEVLGEEMADVVVPLPPADAAWLHLPASANITLVARKSPRVWRGRATTLLPVVEEAGRSPELLVEVSHPFGRGDIWPMLADGSFVEVAVEGRLLKGVYILPPVAIHRNGTVWIVDGHGLLRFQRVDVIRRAREMVVVKGLRPGDRVVTTPIQGAAPGMKVRIARRNGG